ncbi:MAG: thiol-disulfide oxidoreductase DCC family protein [bacterium]
MPEAILLFDGRCRFCRWSAARVLGLDRRGELRPVDLHSTEADGLLSGVSEQERLGSWHLIIAGRRYSAGAAFAPLAGLLPLGRIPAGVLKTWQGPVERAYGFTASQRSRLGRLVTEGADRRATERIQSRS